MSIKKLLVYVVIVCLLAGAVGCGKPQTAESTTAAEASWTCSCGQVNYGNFCTACGKAHEPGAGGEQIPSVTVDVPATEQTTAQDTEPAHTTERTVTGIENRANGSADVVETFWTDGEFRYQFSSAISQNIFVTFSDGSEMVLTDAMEAGLVTVDDLTDAGIRYSIVEKSDASSHPIKDAVCRAAAERHRHDDTEFDACSFGVYGRDRTEDGIVWYCGYLYREYAEDEYKYHILHERADVVSLTVDHDGHIIDYCEHDEEDFGTGIKRHLRSSVGDTIEYILDSEHHAYDCDRLAEEHFCGTPGSGEHHTGGHDGDHHDDAHHSSGYTGSPADDNDSDNSGEVYQDGAEVYLDPDWTYAGNSVINSGHAVMYRAIYNRKGIVIGVNAGHGTKDVGDKKTLCHPDGSPKVTGGTTGAGAKKAIAVSSGMTFNSGMKEHQATYQLAQELKRQLLNAGYDVLMIRDEPDVQLDNVARTIICNNAADCHIALHWDDDGLSYDKGCFFMSVPDELKDMQPVKSTWKDSEALGKALIRGLKAEGLKIYGSGEMDMDLTQTSYSTVPSVDIELGNQCSEPANGEYTQELIRGLIAGIDAYFD